MLSGILIGLGVILIITWFQTRNKMIHEGTWETEGGSGAYLWLIIYIGLIVAGVIV